jgi:acyl-CoA thioester hydrolase
MPENAQRISVRVYYEDTDFSGRVYHASYLRFFERGRTEWLRSFGLGHKTIAETRETAFAVTRLEVEFSAAAVIDDLLEVATELHELRGPVLKFRQIVTRDGARLVAGVVDIVAIRGNRAVRPPREILNALSAVVPRGADRS